MIFGYFIFFTATLLSFVAAYYSVTGLAAIFAAAAVPVIIMGGILELGKVVTTVWLHTNWHRVPKMFKFYLVPAVVFLMLLTSMGIFGFLSKAHLDQAVPTGDVAAQVQIYDEKIQTQRDNVDASRKALRQLDESVDQLMGRSTDERGADKAVSLRRSQAKERQRLQNEITQAQKEIAKLQQERSPIASQLRKVEAEVGPIKYIAALLYGDTADQSTLEDAVRWVIILIVLVFDPLALVLILAGTKQISWARGKSDHQSTITSKEDSNSCDLANEIENLEAQLAAATTKQKKYSEEIQDLNAALAAKSGDLQELIATAAATNDEQNQTIKQLTDQLVDQQTLKGNYETLQSEYVELYNSKVSTESLLKQKTIEISKLEQQINELKKTIDTIEYVGPDSSTTEIEPEFEIAQDQIENQSSDAVATNINVVPVAISPTEAPIDDSAPNAAFGAKFPANPSKGDLFLRIDYLPSRLYKWNDTKWIEIDKSVTDSYTYDEAYIKFLITKLANGDYDTDDLSEAEQEQVTEYLKRTRRV